MKTEPKVIIPKDIYDKVMHWVFRAGNREISGLGKCEYDEKSNTFKVVDAAVLEQSIQTAGNTEFTAEAAGKYMYQSKDTGEYMWWWHSHHSMGAFWSTTDLACIKSFAVQGLVVATVFNNKHEHLSAVSYGKKVKATSESVFGKEELDEVQEVLYDKIKASVLSYYDTSVFKQWSDEYDAAQKTETVQVYNRRHYEYGDYWDRGKDTSKSKIRLPSKSVRKKWQQIKDFEKYIFEDPNEKTMIDWVFRKGDWVAAEDWDYQVKDILAHPAWRLPDNKIVNLPGTTEETAKKVIQELFDGSKDPDDDDISEADLMTNEEREEREDQARVNMGLSAEEWKAMGRYEQERWLERYDGYINYGIYGY